MKFTKMHGLGNDFIMMENLNNTRKDWANIAKKLCHRNLGIGADGLILVESGDKTQYKMVIYNSDGSLAKMCGNGIRCFHKYLYDKGLSREKELLIDTDSGIKQVTLKIELNKVVSVKVDMGPPLFDIESIPLDPIEYRKNANTIYIDNTKFEITPISMGNPHAVIFVDDVDNFPVEKYGPIIEKHPLFPQQTNVEFVTLDAKGNLKMRVWERGVGETQACGTGACATFVAGSMNKKVSQQGIVKLLGGELYITWDGKNVLMEGPAETVFEGQILI